MLGNSVYFTRKIFFRDRCLDLRVELEKRHVQETKECQLQQMRENESRREADRELEKFWYDVMVKEIEAKVSLLEQFQLLF